MNVCERQPEVGLVICLRNVQVELRKISRTRQYRVAVPDTQSESSHSLNRLLDSLPSVEYQRLRTGLHDVTLSADEILVEPFQPTNKVYFLGDGVCSISTSTADGRSASVALVGNEGIIGIGGCFYDREGPKTSAVAIVNGRAQVMAMNVFRHELAHPSGLSDVMHHYCKTFTECLMQSVACNALHTIEQRYARCLLEIRDRVGEDEFALTQDALADMLGVRRASITVAAGALHRADIVEHGHKHIVIRDAARLERTACECYIVIRTCFRKFS